MAATSDPRFEPIESGHTSCIGCAFDDDYIRCATHACDPQRFPLGHPLRNAPHHGIIWIKKERQ